MQIGRKLTALMLLVLSINMFNIGNVQAKTENKKVQTVKKKNTTQKNTKKNVKKTKKKVVKKRSGAYTPKKDVIYSIYDMNSRKFLEKNRIYSKHSIASLTKLMSSYVFLKEIPDFKNCSIKINDEDKDHLKNTRSHLRKEFPLKCSTILKATLSLSDNYAAASLSRSVPHLSKNQFIRKMNEQAKKWNMNHTTFADSSGLNPANKSTANDLTKFLINVVKTPEYKLMEEASTLKQVGIPSTQGWKNYKNTNKLIREEKFDASLSKTGFINEAGYNLMFIPEHCANNRKLALVIMGEKTSYNRSALATQLLNKYKCK